jgi:ABC-2 type transport system ATP-binding protein
MQNLEFFAGIYNARGEKKQKVIDLMVDIFGFRDFVDETVSDLSLGFKQRLALSCAVMHWPRVLFLDEPTSGVDPITRREFWNHINGMVEKGGTVVVTTHFMDEAEYCDRIGLVYKSNLIEMGTPDELKARCATPEMPSPTLEDAFIHLIEKYEQEHAE